MVAPKTISEGGASFVLNLFKFTFLVEDRRPDLDYGTAKKTLGYKYKTSIEIRFAGKVVFSLQVKSLSKPIIKL